MKKADSFWVGLFIGAIVSGTTGYWLGLRAGVADTPMLSPVQRKQERPDSQVRAADSAQAGSRLCAEGELETLTPPTLLTCLQRSGFADNPATLIPALKHYFAYVLNRKALLSQLVDILAREGAVSPEYLLIYIEAEVDREKIGLAGEALKQLLKQQWESGFSGSDVSWLIDYLNRLLWLTPNDVSLNLWLAKLFLQQGKIEEVRYHALIAANSPAYEEEAGNLLREIAPEGDDDGSIVVNLEVMGNQYYIAAEINGYPARLLLDTGASISGVSAQFVEKHRNIVRATQSIMLSTAAGVKTVSKFTVDELAFGELRFSDHPMVILEGASFNRFDGLLGVDVLQQSDFFIDRKESKLRIFSDK